jgi:hypothetical protein
MKNLRHRSQAPAWERHFWPKLCLGTTPSLPFKEKLRMRTEPKKPLAMQENPDMRKLFSDPSDQIRFSYGGQRLVPLWPPFSATSRNQVRPCRHKALWQRHNGGCEPEVNGPTAVPGGPQANVSAIKRSKFHMLRLIVSELSGTWHKKGQKKGFTRVLGARKRP